MWTAERVWHRCRVLVDGVWLRYSRRGPWILCGVDAAAAPGDVVVLSGRNGAGKSSLLQIVAGVLAATRGWVRDRPRRVGWVPEKFPADQPFTAREYLRHMSLGAASAADVDGWLDRLGMSAHGDTRLGELSKGTAQKVGLAQAMLMRPELLILDEPWEGLDAATRDLVPGLVQDVARAGGIVLISDHRGETARLPGAAHWTLEDGTLRTAAAQAHSIIEIAVPAARVAATADELRAAGHDIIRIREREAA